MYQLEITETGRNSLKEESQTFNRVSLRFFNLDDLKKELIDRYGKMPKMKNKIYQDKKDGSTIETGFTHSFWNQDISHNSDKWYQTDWICISEIDLRPFDLSLLK